MAYPAKWAEGFGEDYYQSIKQNTLSSDGEWNSQATGTPYETTELNVSTPEEVRKQLDEILNEINLKGGTHGCHPREMSRNRKADIIWQNQDISR